MTMGTDAHPADPAGRTELVDLARRWQLEAGTCRTPEEDQKRQVLLACARQLLEFVDRMPQSGGTG
jgi:hypothetical protein